jgi:hypothetical protein
MQKVVGSSPIIRSKRPAKRDRPFSHQRTMNEILSRELDNVCGAGDIGATTRPSAQPRETPKRWPMTGRALTRALGARERAPRAQGRSSQGASRPEGREAASAPGEAPRAGPIAVWIERGYGARLASGFRLRTALVDHTTPEPMSSGSLPSLAAVPSLPGDARLGLAA